MTVVVGILCENGVVLGADSSMTFAAGMMPTIEQPTRKIFAVGSDVLFAGSGEVGLIQRMADQAKRAREQHNFAAKERFFGPKLVARLTIEDLAETHAAAGKMTAVMAYPSKEGPQLCEFTTPSNLQPELKTSANWFVAIGNGQQICDPFLAFLRRVFFEGKQPQLSDGIFAALWAIDLAIELNPAGINKPAVISVLEKARSASTWSARILDESELPEHRENIQGAEKHIASYRELSKKTATTPPPT
jgi:20S proteasome alpha/beta subunit